MALIDSFFPDQRDCRRHRSRVDCGWQVIADDSGRVLQFATFGSDERASVKKVSQTVQLDEQGARLMLGLLESFLAGHGTAS